MKDDDIRTELPAPPAPITRRAFTLMSVATGLATAACAGGGGGAAAIKLPTAAMPTFNPTPGSFAGAQSVTLADATAGATIFYTTDGTAPTTSSMQFVAGTPVRVTATTTINAIAIAPNYDNSSVASGTYTIVPPSTTAAPTFSPAPGSYTGAQSVTLSDATPGAIIYYTTDGTTPTAASAQFVAGTPVQITSTTTVSAIAVAAGDASSSVVTGTYTITPVATAVKSATGSFTIGAGSTADVVVAGLGFSPTLVLFFYTGEELYGNDPSISAVPSYDQYAGMGAMNGTDEWSQSIAARWGDGRRDGGVYASTVINTRNYTDSGCSARRKSIDADGFTLQVTSAPSQQPLTVQWFALGGSLTAHVGVLTNVTTGPVSIDAGFTPTAVLTSLWHQAYQTGNGLYASSPYPTFAQGNEFAQEYATAGVSFGVASAVGEQAAVMGHVGYDGNIWSLASNANCVFATGRLTEIQAAQHVGTLAGFSGTKVNLNFGTADGTADLIYPFVILGGCKAKVVQDTMRTSAGSFDITGASFQPVAVLMGAAPGIVANQSSFNPSTSLNVFGNHNITVGAASAAGQCGFSYWDTLARNNDGTPILTNPVNPSVNLARHNPNTMIYSGVMLRGQQHPAPASPTTDKGTFSVQGEVTFSSFLPNGVRVNQTNAAAVAGKIAVLMIGDP